MQDKEPTYYYNAWKFPLEEFSSEDQNRALSALFKMPSGLARVEVYIAGKRILSADRRKDSRVDKNILERIFAGEKGELGVYLSPGLRFAHIPTQHVLRVEPDFGESTDSSREYLDDKTVLAETFFLSTLANQAQEMYDLIKVVLQRK